MNDATRSVGILIVSHGSPRAEANQRVRGRWSSASPRGWDGTDVLPAFFSIARPDIPDQVAVLAGARACGGSCSCPIFSTRAST